MNTVRRSKRPVNSQTQGQRRLADFILDVGVDTVVEVIQALIPLGLMHVGEVLEAEVAHLAGKRYRRGEGQPGHVRWGRQRGCSLPV